MSEPLKDLTAALRRLELSASQQTIYLSLLREGAASARTLAARTGVTRPSVYDQLKALRIHGLIVEKEEDGVACFAATDIRQLDTLLADKVERIERSRSSLKASLPTLLKDFKTVHPKIRFFEGSEEVKNILKDILWNTPKKLTIVWPTTHMSGVFDAAYISWFAERLAAQGVHITLSASADHPFTTCSLTSSKILKTEPTMATVIYGHRVAHISSPKESFGFIVESSDYSNLQSDIQ